MFEQYLNYCKEKGLKPCLVTSMNLFFNQVKFRAYQIFLTIQLWIFSIKLIRIKQEDKKCNNSFTLDIGIGRRVCEKRDTFHYVFSCFTDVYVLLFY